VLRIEDGRAVRTLGLATFARFQSQLRALFEAHLGVREAPVVGEALDGDVISLDPMLPARASLAISRLYAMGGYEPLGHVARPGAPPLDAQRDALAPGDYTLFDDDRVSGGTLAAARALVPAHARITGVRVAVEHDDDEDVADSRDFLLGADDGGLVLALPGGGIGRAPYALPYVDPAVRCSVPAAHALAFSAAVWSLNASHFERTSLRVGDLPPPARATFAFMGERTPLADVCRAHLDRLRRT
jgi:hypothetical protein